MNGGALKTWIGP